MKQLLFPATLAGALTIGLVAASPARAQVRIVQQTPVPSLASQSLNRNPYVAPGVTLQQYAYNLNVLGQAYSKVPPYALGYNPYPSVINYGPLYGAYPSPYLGLYANPYGSLPPTYSLYPSTSLSSP